MHWVSDYIHPYKDAGNVVLHTKLKTDSMRQWNCH